MIDLTVDPGNFRVACVQFEPRIGEVAANLVKISEFVRTAAVNGARLVVLPELANTGYVFESHEEVLNLSEQVPDGVTCRILIDLARETGAHIVSGIAEKSNDQFFNSAVVVGPEGYIGTYRKNHLWNREHLYFEPGDSGFPVFDTDLGRIGVAICYDGWFPETFRSLVLAGADLVCVPTNWVPMPAQNPSREAMANILHMAAAHSNSIFIACADRIGTERGQPFEGQSIIVGPTGWLLAGPSSRDGEEILYADVDLAAARAGRQLNAFNNVLQDRRPETYEALRLKSADKAPAV